MFSSAPSHTILFTFANSVPLRIFGVRGSLDELWPEFSRSPILTSFAYSPLVELGFDTNRDLFLPSSLLSPSLAPSPPYLSSLPPPPALTNAERYAPIPGLMVLHVRRGDYSYHCDFLAAAPEDFIVTNTLPGLPDTFTLPGAGIMDQFRIPTDWRRDRQNVLTPEAAAIYRRRCYPTVEQMAHKVREVLATPAAQGVRRLYVMTNAKAEFVDELRAKLVEVKDDWEVIASSRDLALNWEQKYISQAIDAIAAQRAQVFIGNGVSVSFSVMSCVMHDPALTLSVDSSRRSRRTQSCSASRTGSLWRASGFGSCSESIARTAPLSAMWRRTPQANHTLCIYIRFNIECNR